MQPNNKSTARFEEYIFQKMKQEKKKILEFKTKRIKLFALVAKIYC